MGLTVLFHTIYRFHYTMEKLYSPHYGPYHLFTILIKDSYLFKITELVFNFYLKFYNFK